MKINTLVLAMDIILGVDKLGIKKVKTGKDTRTVYMRGKRTKGTNMVKAIRAFNRSGNLSEWKADGATKSGIIGGHWYIIQEQKR